MTEPSPTKTPDIRHDDSLTEDEAMSVANAENCLFIAKDTNKIIHVDSVGVRRVSCIMHEKTGDPDSDDTADSGYNNGDFWRNNADHVLWWKVAEEGEEETGTSAIWVNLSESESTEVTLQDAYDAGNEIDIAIDAPLNFQLDEENFFKLTAIEEVGELHLSMSLDQADLRARDLMDIFCEDGDVRFQDENLDEPLSLSEAGQIELDTTSDSLVGAINELYGQAGSGEANTSSSGGAGVGLAMTKDGVDLPIKSLTSDDSTIDITGDTSEVDLSLADSSVTTAKIGATGTPGSTTFFRGDGSWSTADNAITIQGIPVSDYIPPVDTAKSYLLNLITYTNAATWTSDIAQSVWSKEDVITDGTDGLIADTGSAGHQILDGLGSIETDTTYTISALVEKGTSDYVILLAGGGLGRTSFNISNGTIHASTADDASITLEASGKYRCRTQFTSATTAATKRIFVRLTEDGTTETFVGDGVSVMTRVSELQIDETTVNDNLPHIPTTTVAVSADAYILEEKIDGLSTTYLAADGDTITVTDGIIVSKA